MPSPHLSIASAASALLLLAAPATAGTPVSFHTSLVAHEPMTTASDISATGDLVIVGRELQGVSIVDVGNVANPTILATWNHPTVEIFVRDARPMGSLVWCTNERNGEFGTFAIDISTPSSPSLLTELQPPTFPSRVHNLWPDGTDLYLSGTSNPSGNFIVDVSDPLAPAVRAVMQSDVHDNSVVGDSLYYAAGYDGLFLYDVTNPDTPVEIGLYTSSDTDTLYYAHNAFPIVGTDYVVLTEEIQRPIFGTRIAGSTRVVDFSDPQNPVDVWRYKSESQKTSTDVGPHNAYVVGDFLYLSHYHDGLKIFDVTVPDDPVEVAFYDTFPDLPEDLFEGCWGVDAFQGPDRIFLSDRTYGFFHVTFDGARRSIVSGQVIDAVTQLPIEGARFQSLTAARTTHTDAGGGYIFKTGEGTHEIVVSAPGYIPEVAELVLAANGSIVEDFELTPTAVGVPGAASAARLSLRVGPNPTGGTATFRYAVSAEFAGEAVAIDIYDVAGRRVRALEADAGAGAYTWDGRTEAGFPVANGVYVVSLRAGTETVSERLVVRR